MKKSNILRMAMAALLTLALAGCKHEETHINVSSGQVVGLWVKSGSQEYWRYRTGGTGVTWDEAEDISEEESNLTFTWTLDGDLLEHRFSGRNGNQDVTRYYTITEISSSTMKWKDADYDNTYTLTKVKQQ